MYRGTIIILMKYDEPEWNETLNCAINTGCPVIIADRSGIGSMAKAYNKAFTENWELIMNFKYVWFVSNIMFTTDDLDKLIDAMEDNGRIDCIHPCFMSDHQHLRPNIGASPQVQEIDYVEFTAPLMHVSLFRDYPLDEDMPFVGHDLDWSYRVKEHGNYALCVHYGVQVLHKYIRHNENGHVVTRQRKKIRKSWEEYTTRALINKYGSDWRLKLKYHGAV